MGRVLTICTLSFTFMFLFQNCQSFESASTKDLSSQCQAQVKTKILSEGGWREGECSNLNNYHCALKAYKPDLETAQFEDQECIHWEGDSICFDLEVSTFSTSSLLNNPNVSDEEFLEGGNLNRTEYRCMQTGIMLGEKPIIVEVAESLESALSKAQETCKKGVKL